MAAFIARFLLRTQHRLCSVSGYNVAKRSTLAEEPLSAHDEIETILKDRTKDMPVSDITNPYQKDKQLCILCKYKIQVDYKNTKLLSQFISPFSGQLYDKRITGLCEEQYRRVGECIKKAQQFGLMPYMFKDLAFVKDPKLCNLSSTMRKK